MFAGCVVQDDLGGRDVLLEVGDRGRARDEQDAGVEVEQRGEGDLRRRRPEALRNRCRAGSPRTSLTPKPLPSGKNGTNEMPRAMHSSSTGCDERSTRL